MRRESAGILLEYFPHGLLTYLPSDDAWREDPCLFRRGELMLGIISHEGEGVLRIEPREQLALDQSSEVVGLSAGHDCHHAVIIALGQLTAATKLQHVRPRYDRGFDRTDSAAC